tara:strand:+ start:28263 stop:28445 length:183 start_codon:yes stop_codon:yes gene_type:complete
MINGFKDGFINLGEYFSIKTILPAIGIVEGFSAAAIEVLFDGAKQVCLGVFLNIVSIVDR